MNFRIPIPLKVQFEETCHQLRSNMTAELNRMIRDFVKGSKEDLYEPPALIKDLISEDVIFSTSQPGIPFYLDNLNQASIPIK